MDQNLANITDLSAYAEYQPNSIVSHPVLKKPTGNITFFSFDKGQELSEHTAPFDAFLYVADGKADITISGKVYEVKKGEFINLPANQPHSVKAKERFKMLLVMIRS